MDMMERIAAAATQYDAKKLRDECQRDGHPVEAFLAATRRISEIGAANIAAAKARKEEESEKSKPVYTPGLITYKQSMRYDRNDPRAAAIMGYDPY